MDRYNRSIGAGYPSLSPSASFGLDEDLLERLYSMFSGGSTRRNRRIGTATSTSSGGTSGGSTGGGGTGGGRGGSGGGAGDGSGNPTGLL